MLWLKSVNLLLCRGGYLIIPFSRFFIQYGRVETVTELHLFLLLFKGQLNVLKRFLGFMVLISTFSVFFRQCYEKQLRNSSASDSTGSI